MYSHLATDPGIDMR